MTQTGVVVRIIDDKTAEVSVERETACGGNCGACGGTCVFRNQLTAVVFNKATASLGDKVVIESRTSRIIGAAALVYILPVLTLLAGYMASALAGASESVSVLASVLSLGFGMLISVLVSRRKRAKKISFEIISIL